MSEGKVRIEIKLGEPDNPELHIVGQADEQIVDQTLKFFGLRYKEPAPPIPLKAVGVIVCEHHLECTDYPSKCNDCASNKAKSYFESKESSESV